MTNSSFNSKVCASLAAAAFRLSAVPFANSILLDIVCASLAAAAFLLRVRRYAAASNGGRHNVVAWSHVVFFRHVVTGLYAISCLIVAEFLPILSQKDIKNRFHFKLIIL
jgi:hypothetical protein